jgi:outer membrane protein TolC
MRLLLGSSLGLALVILAASPAPAQPAAPKQTAGGAPAAAAPEATSPDTALQAATTPSATASFPPDALKLSLDEAIQKGLEKNLDIQVQRFAPYIALERLREAWGAYDPLFAAQLGYSFANQPVASPFQASGSITQRLTDGSAGLQGVLPWLGTGYSVDYLGQRLLTDSAIAGFSPELDAALGFSLTQPLLKNLIWNQPWTQVKSSRIASAEEEENFRRQVMDTVRDIETAYWGVIAASEQLRVAQVSLDTSKALLDQTRTQYEVGVVSKVEVTEAEAGVAEREVNVITAKNAYRASQDNLINLVLGTDLTAASTLEIEPTDRPATTVTYAVDEEEATKKAFERRPELAAAHQEIERQQITLQFAKNQKLPQLDVRTTYGYQGLSGEVNPHALQLPPSFCPGGVCPPPPEPDRNFWDANHFFDGRNGMNWSTRGLFSIPLGNRAADAREAQAELSLARARSSERRLGQNIVLEVRAAVRNLRSAQEGIVAAERRRLAAAEQLRAERIRLENGESTPFDVLQRERDLVDAESQKIAAEQIYRNSITGLDRAQGTILESRNIRVEDVRALR